MGGNRELEDARRYEIEIRKLLGVKFHEKSIMCVRCRRLFTAYNEKTHTCFHCLVEDYKEGKLGR